jgi:hypothetical protein
LTGALAAGDLDGARLVNDTLARLLAAELPGATREEAQLEGEGEAAAVVHLDQARGRRQAGRS